MSILSGYLRKYKRDIFLQGLQKENKEKLFPILEFKNKKITKENLYNTIDRISNDYQSL